MAEIYPLLQKLDHAVVLSHRQQEVLDGLLSPPVSVPGGAVLVAEGEHVNGGFVILRGWAVRERLLDTGGRQIISFLVPGDLSHYSAVRSRYSDHTLTALGPVTLRRFTAEHLFSAMLEDPDLNTALWWLAGLEAAILKEHVVALGRRSARARVLYLVWELWRRLTLVGQAHDGHFDFPASQEVLADAVGMTSRHLGRVMARLHDDGIIRFKNGRLSILDHARLMAEADCRDEHLSLTPGGTVARRPRGRRSGAGLTPAPPRPSPAPAPATPRPAARPRSA